MANSIAIGRKLLTDLDTPCGDNHDYIKIGKEIIYSSFTLLIEYNNIFLNKHVTNKADTVTKLLYVRCINDLSAGFHLANHSYVSQFYSVTRPIFETLDLIELFKVRKDLMEMWLNDPEKFKKNFKLPVIRKTIKKDHQDPIYSMFCKYGSHPTVDSIKSGAYWEKDTLKILYGPTDLFFPAILPFIFSYILLLFITVSITKSYGVDVFGDTKNYLIPIFENYKEYSEKCIFSAFKKNGENLGPIKNVIEHSNALVDKMLEIWNVSNQG